LTDVSEAIDVLLEGVVPERVAELKATWGEQQDRVRLQDGGGFLLHQVYGTVQVSWRPLSFQVKLAMSPVGSKRTSRCGLMMSVHRGRADSP
jgi:hypothetical protein